MHIDDSYPLSPVQEGLLFHSLAEPADTAYLFQFCYAIAGPFQMPAFEQAWARTIARHPILRSAFVWEKTEPVQAVHRDAVLPMQYLDWSNDTGDTQRRFDAFVNEDRRRVFDLKTPPLMRLTVIRLPDGHHRLVWTFHHLVLDGWSLAIVLQEIARSYAALLQGRAPALPEARPFRDYISWLARQDTARAKTFWTERLRHFEEAAPLMLEPLSTDVSSPDDQGDVRLRLDEASTAALKDFAREQRITVSTIVHGAWALLLSRYTRQPRVSFATVVSGRPPQLGGIESIVGLFINTLPVVLRVPSDAAIGGWLRDLQQQLAETREFDYSSLAQIQRWCGLSPRAALFETVVVFENYPTGSGVLSQGRGAGVRPLQTYERSTYPLTLVVLPGSVLTFSAQYDTARFTRAPVTRLLEHLRTLLQTMIGHAEAPISGLALSTAAERERILRQFNRGPGSKAPGSLLARFDAWVARQPEGIALLDGGVTYAALDDRSDLLARWLREHVDVGRPIALALADPVLQVEAILGVLKAGAAFVAFELEWPAERLQYLLDDADPGCVLVEPATRERLTAIGLGASCRVAVLSRVESPRPLAGETLGAPFAAREGNLPAAADRHPDPAWAGDDPERAFCLVYTSGSTGTPKGIVQTSRNLAQYIDWLIDTFELGPGDRVSQWAGLSYDAAYCEIFGALCSGATLASVPRAIWRDASAVGAWLRAHAITAFGTVPSFCRELLRMLDPAPADPLPALRHLFLAGETLTADLVAEWNQRCGSRASVTNLYGPTECILATHHAVASEAAPTVAAAGAVPIGRPIAGRGVAVLDIAGQHAPIGVMGEIHIASPYLALGYHRRPEETAKAFLRNSALPGAGDRMYRTGDLGRWTPEGVLEFLGRADHQVKIRGMRVELEEIEVAVLRHSRLRECAVAVVDAHDEQGGRLVACIAGDLSIDGTVSAATPAASAGDDRVARFGQEIARRLTHALPEHMIPSRYVALDHLPRTSSGKIDRKALPIVSGTGTGTAAAAADYAVPRSPIEVLVTEVWRDVLRVDRVGIDDHFFRRGGHSLLATRVIVRLRESLAIEIPLTELFDYPTPATLAARLEALCQEARRPATPHDEAVAL